MKRTTSLSPYIERPTRAFVKRLGAERYIFISLVAFATSVVLTRLFLDLTGYPQIGNSHLHIAHVLWGGLLLFIGGLIPLIIANAWGYTASAVLNGAGMGLFIDEVGKFITQTNDYFFPAAAPIIYAFFLMTVMMYIYVRRHDHSTPRHEMYQALHDLGEVVDHDLDHQERAALQARLQNVIDAAPGSNLALLSAALLTFLYSEGLRLANVRPSRWQQMQDRFNAWGRGLNRTLYRGLLVGLMLGGGLIGLSRSTGLLFAAFTNWRLEDEIRAWLVEGRFQSISELRWLIIRLSLEGTLAALLVFAAILLLLRREKLALNLAALVLTMLLTTVNLLVFYFDQFSAVSAALAQYLLLALLLVYRRWYLHPQPAPLPAPAEVWDDNGIRE